MIPTSDQANGPRFDVWKDLARKYRRLRKESEAENRHLCDIYTRQTATIETLRRLLQMQEQVKQTLRSSNKCGIHYYFDADDGDMVVMQRLRGDLEQ
ncbi:hypothetical protein F444_13051, partial [Phytophthora nicotianae P1976]